MNTLSKEEVIAQIVEVVKVPFEKKGFMLKRKRYFERTDTYSNVQQYEVNLANRKGFFSLHLILRVLNRPLLKKVNAVLEKALRAEEYEYPDNWDKTIIEGTIKERVAQYTLAGLTDWREFKPSDESLEDFNARFSIWFCVFDNIEEKKGWRKQLLDSVDFAENWFATVAKDSEWVIKNTDYPALFLLKEEGRESELQQKYHEVLSESRLKKEAELFYRHLIL
ncbi:MAG: hypothetical protein FWG42_11555 [Clostridiales bacterium]|nr:hypothetical protein [Clostridiales bacterium]